MIRFHDWPTRLAKYFEDCQDTPFEYGAFDCVLFACGALQAMTGIHPLQQYIGKYKSSVTAARQMKTYAGGGVPETAAKASLSIGLRPTSPALAKRGDMVLVVQEGTAAWGVVDLNAGFARVVSANEAGAGQIPLKFVTHCWSFN